MLASASGAIAGVTTSTDQRNFVVQGTTARGLVRYMNSNAVSGDHGHAYASIHPDYQLSLSTKQSGGMCRASLVDVHIDFELILPVAASPGGMSSRVRGAWNSFSNFARAHEGHHKASYTGCATSFVAQARRQSAGQCFVLESNIRQMLSQMKRDCEARQMPFDRAQARVLRNMSLFSLARWGK